MEVIVPASDGWRFICAAPDAYGPTCLPALICVIAWAIGESVVPITPLGPVDISQPYILGTPADNYLVMPSGPVLRDYNEMVAYLQHLGGRR